MWYHVKYKWRSILLKKETIKVKVKYKTTNEKERKKNVTEAVKRYIKYTIKMSAEA